MSDAPSSSTFEDRPPDELLAAAERALLQGRAEQARAHCRAAFVRLGASAAPAVTAGAVARLEARACLAEGNGDAALDALTAALAIAEATDDVARAASAQNLVAIVHFQRGQLDEAEQIYAAARALAQQAADARLVALTTLNLGIVANIRGDLRGALACYHRSLTDFRELETAGDVALALNNLGMLYTDLGQWTEAEASYAEAVAICTRTGDLDALTRLHGNRAEMWLGRGDVASARAACDEAMRTCRRTPHGAALGEVHKMYGAVARELGAFEEADVHFARAEQAARGREDLLLLAETAREQAELYRRQGRNRDTLQALNRAHRLFERLRARRDLADVDRRMGRLEGDFVEVARRWGESIEAKDRYTQGHCQRVADLACRVAARAGLDDQALFWFRIGALLHDVGKLIIPAEVLNKPGKLTDEEWALMRAHPSAGVAMLADIEFPWDIRPILESHHERWDGKGYPHGLVGEQIPLTARILGVADVYDALTSVRSYKRAMAHDDALALLRKDAGTAFDPVVLAWFEEIVPAWLAESAASGGAPAALTDEEATLRVTRRAGGHDEVTGLPVRRAFFDECARVLAARRDDARPVALLIVAVDDFAAHHAAHGRAAADALLQRTAETLSRNTRGGDFVGRYADDEFVVLLPDVPLAEARTAAERLRDAVASQHAAAAAGGAVPATVTIGAAAFPDHGATPEALLAAADAALRRGRRARVAPTADSAARPTSAAA